MFIIMQLFILLFLNAKSTSYAMDAGFSMEKLSDAEKDEYINRYFDISMLTTEPPKRPIECFDVNKNGMIAIGYSCFLMSPQKNICVYTEDGSFLYGYRFEDTGSFGIEWDDDNLIIYSVRASKAIAVNQAGEVEYVATINKTIDNHNYWQESVFSKKRTVGDTNYKLKNNMGTLNLVAYSYSQVVVEESDGKNTVVYDANTYHFITLCLIILVYFAMYCIVITRLIREVVKQRRLYKLKQKSM